MNEVDKLKLQKRLSQLHDLQRQTEKLGMDDDQGMETGYVTDSSINSRKGTKFVRDSKFFFNHFIVYFYILLYTLRY